MIYFYILGLLCAVFLFGELLLTLFYNKKIQLIFNVILLTAILLFFLYLGYNSYYESFMNLFTIDAFSEFFILIFTMGVILINLLYYSFSDDYRELSLLLTFSIMGMYLVALSNTLSGIFIGLELMSIPSIFSVLLSKKSLEAATKFFIMAGVSIALFSFAMALTYGGNNTILLIQSQYSTILLIGVILFIISLGFEASIFPFNVLIPDIYEGAPSYITGLLGGVNKSVGFAALIQILIIVFILFHSAFIVIAILATFTMFYGNIGALMQKDLKRMMAYSSISQAGYMLIGIAAATVYGVSGTLFQILAHMFIFIGLFAILSVLERMNLKTIDDVAGLSNKNPFISIAFVLFMLSLVGLPFTTGFVGKLLIFLSAISAGIGILAVLGILNSIISLYYYLKIVLSIYSKDQKKKYIIVPNTALIVIILCLGITIFFGIYPQIALGLINNAANYLFKIFI